MSIWGTVFNAILGGISASSKEKSAAKLSKDQIKQTGEEDRKSLILKAGEDRKTTAFAASLEDWYKQRDRKEKRDALGLYGGFSTMGQFAPQYNGADFKPIQPGALPNPVAYGQDSNYAGLSAAALANQSKYKGT